MDHNTSETSQPEKGRRPERLLWFKDWALLLTVPAVIAVDQFTKFLVKMNLDLGESWPAEGLVRLTYGTNTGTAFGLFPNQTGVLIVASVIAIGFLVYFYRAHAMPRAVLRFAIGLQLGGAFGNLFDRLRSGSVVDFIDIGWWPIFNVADSSIVLGMTLLIGILLLMETDDKGASTTPRSVRPSEGDGNGT